MRTAHKNVKNIFVKEIKFKYVKKEDKITVEGCSNCPFKHSEYDDYALGFDTLDICVLSRFLNEKEYLIEAYDSYSKEKRHRRLRSVRNPKWCPLNNKDLMVKKRD